VQSARIAGFCGNSIPLPSSGGSQQNPSKSNAIISPIIIYRVIKKKMEYALEICSAVLLQL